MSKNNVSPYILNDEYNKINDDKDDENITDDEYEEKNNKCNESITYNDYIQ